MLKFSIVERPGDMEIDEASGIISWNPQMNNVGNHSVTVRVEDGRGGFAQQRDVLSAIEPPPNRPPRITSIPVTETTVTDGLAAGLLSYWRFDGNGIDTAPGRRDMTLEGGVGFDDGLFGQALDLHRDPTRFAMRPLDDPEFDFGSGDFTIQTWVNLNSVTGEQVFLEKFENSNPPGWSITKLASRQMHFSPSPLFPTVNYTPGVWNHVVFRKEDGMLAEYINGQLVDSAPHSELADTDLPLIIGKRNDRDGRNFAVDGRIDEVAIWERGLSEEEIVQLYNDGAGVELMLKGSYSYDVDAIDPDSDTISYSLVTAPDRMHISTASGLISWIPVAADIRQHKVVVRADDSRGGVATQSFLVNVAPDRANHDPIIVSRPLTEIGVRVPKGNGELVNLSEWSPVQFDLNQQPDADWVLDDTATVATQVENADPSVLLSDFGLLDKQVAGMFRVNTDFDDDFIGFVFGYQDPEHFYLFDWKQLDQDTPAGVAEAGMSVKIVSADSPLTAKDVTRTAGNGDRVRSIFHNTVGWKEFTDYRFALEFHPGVFTITVKEGDIVVETVTLRDTTYVDGAFGFYNFSQDQVEYSQFRQTQLPRQVYSYNVEAIDPDDDHLEYSLLEAPPGMKIDRESGLIDWLVASTNLGQHAVTVQVADGRGGVDEQSFVIDVVDAATVDLTVGEIDSSDLEFDGQSLAVTGRISATIVNQGDIDITDPFEVLFFEDRDLDEQFTPGVDNVLGNTRVSDPFADGQRTTVHATLAGNVLFSGNRVWVYVDSKNDIAEIDETNNLVTYLCEFVPPAGRFDPVLEWSWTSSELEPDALNVMMTPAVVDLNADGTSDVVFGSTSNTSGSTVQPGLLRAVSGRTGTELFSVTTPEHRINALGQVAVGDIDLDGRPEIVAVHSSGNRLIAFEHDGAFKWISDVLEGITFGGPSIANLDAQTNPASTPEVIVGRQALNSDGTLRWTGTRGRGSIDNFPLSLVADIDMDGRPDVVAGNTVYQADGAILWEAALTDGFNAVADFDEDPFPEIVLVTNGLLSLLEHDGTVKWGPNTIPATSIGGPPTVADFDNDGEIEIGIAGKTAYTVFETDGTVRWSTTINDLSSQVTGSSVFDFEGDGAAEVIYSDHDNLYVYSGRDGSVRFATPLTSCTAFEYPLVADVDADGNAEIVAVANNNCKDIPNVGIGNGPFQRGVFVFGSESDSWVGSRQIWNQHTYHITNVNDDGTIPAIEANNWETFNNYRQNIQTIGSSFAAPDLTASLVRTESAGSDTNITARIGNGGSSLAPAGVSVAFYDGEPGNGGILAGVAQTTQQLDPGQFEDVTVTLQSPVGDLWVVADDDGTGRGTVGECSEDNNAYHPVLGGGRILGTKFHDLNGDGSQNYEHFVESVTVLAEGGALVDPAGVAVAPDGSVLYMTDQLAAAVFSVPAEGGPVSVLATGPMFDNAHGVTISPDGQTLYIAGWGRGEIVSLPTAGGEATVLAAEAHFGAPHGISISPDGSTLYITDTLAGTVFALPSTGGTPTVLASGPPFGSLTQNSPVGVDVTADGRDLYVSAGTSVYRLPTAGGMPIRVGTVPESSSHVSIALSRR